MITRPASSSLSRLAWITAGLLGLAVAFALGSSDMVKLEVRFTLAPLKLSQNDLLAILQHVRSLVQAANQTAENRYPQENLALSGRGVTVTLEGEPRLSDPLAELAELEVADSVDYSYYNSGAAVSSVRIQLRSFEREVRIEGTSPEQVEALAALIRQSFGQHTVWFGGLLGNLAVGLALFVGVQLLVTILERKYGPFPREANLLVSLVAGMLVGLFAMWLDWFPSVSVYRGEASFIVRNNALFSFLGLLATIVVFVVGRYFTRRRRP